MTTYRDIGTNAMRELNILDAEDVPTSADGNFVVAKLNRILDRWNGMGVAAYVTQFATYTLTSGLQPHTIGPTGATFTVSVRPEEIEAAVIYSSTNRTPLRQRDEGWWLSQSSRAMGGIPSDLYYRPSWPNGSIYLWPVPSSALQIEVASRQLFNNAGVLSTTFTLPPGFEDALTKTLAEEIAEAFGTTPGPILREGARDARAMLFANHGKRYPIRSDGGLGLGGSFNMRTGRIE